MALALYRKYRPRTFAEVIGQDHVTEPLSQALRSGRLHHAYLLSGPRGCGKTSSARILARSLNCEQGPTPEPCGVCGSCRSLANDGAGSIDVIEIDAASHGGVDDARELREKAFFAPANSRYKIYVIDEAHMVSSAGFNALLKLVEEPPEYVKFIFATTEPEKVLGTIRSRTHHYPFRLIPPAVLRPYVQQLAEAEGVPVEPAVFPLVVRAGGGSARDTLSVLDQLIAGAGPDGVSYARAVALLGVTDVTLIDEMCDALAAGDGAAAYSTIDRVAEAGHDARRFASDLLERFRDLIVLQQVPDAVAKGLIDGPADQLETMGAQAARLGPATLSRCADIVHNGLVEMRGATAPRLLLELVTARMLLPAADDSSGALLQRLERMERRLALGGEPATSAAPAPGPAAVPAVVPAAAGTGGLAGAGALAGHGAPAGLGAPAEPGTPRGAGAPAAAPAAAEGPSAARAAALAVARRAGSGSGRTGGAPSSAPSSAPLAASSSAPAVAPAPAPASAAADEPDWNEVAGGTGISARAATPAELEEEPPPWDEEPVPPPSAAPAPRAVPAPASAATSAGASAAASAPASSPAPASSAGSAPGAASSPGAAAAAASSPGAAAAAASSPGAAAAAASAAGSSAGASVPGAAPAVTSIVAPTPDTAPAPVRAPTEAPASASAAPARPVVPTSSELSTEAPAGPAQSERPPTAAAAPATAAPTRRVEPAGVLPDAPEEPGAAAIEAVAAGPGRLTAQAVRQVWPEILAEVKRQPRGVVLRAMAVDATVRELEGQTVVLTVPSARHAQGITQGAPLIVKALYEVLGGDWEIRCEVAGEAGAVSYGAAPQSGRRRGAPAARPQAAQTPQATRGSQAAQTPPAAQNARPATAARTTPVAREPQNRRSPAEATASADDDWPEPVKPGGLAAAAPAPAEPVEENGWPEVRKIGVAAPAADASAEVDGPRSASAVERPADGGGSVGAVEDRTASDGPGEDPAVAWPVGGSGARHPGDRATPLGGADFDSAGGVTGNSLGGESAAGAARVAPADGGDHAGPAGVVPAVGPPHAAPAAGPFPAADGEATHAAGALGPGGGPAGRGQDVAPGQAASNGGPADSDGPANFGGPAGSTGLAGSGSPSGSGGLTGSGGLAGSDGPANSGGPAGSTGLAGSGGWAGSGGPGGSGSSAGSGGLAGSGSPAAAPSSVPVGSHSTAHPADGSGGPAAAVSGPPRGAAGGSVIPESAASPPAAAPARPGRNAAPSSGLAAARAAAAGARNAATRQTAKPANAAWSDGSPTEEAPYDPEFDGPPSGRNRSFEGFDPGDEPLDDVIDEKTARESSEQQAMRLLQEALGAEKIGES